MEHEADDQSPERETHHQPLGQGRSFVGLPQRDTDDDIADSGQRDKFGRQKQQAGNDRGGNEHLVAHD